MGTERELNVIRIGDSEFLLTEGGGQAIHLTRRASEDGVMVAAVPDYYLDELEKAYDREALDDPRWHETTLCGRQWVAMASGADSQGGRAVFAPTCRRCLAIMDKLFPEPQLNDRFSLIVQFVTDTILVHGTAEILGVPGDHQSALRKEVRAVVKQRTGHGMESYAHEGIVIFVCRPIYDEHAEEHERQMAAIMNARWSGGPAPEVPPIRMSWGELTSD
jgi:hypothetical protein